MADILDDLRVSALGFDDDLDLDLHALLPIGPENNTSCGAVRAQKLMENVFRPGAIRILLQLKH